jgi:Ni/Co efflux regulator RcnB
MQNDKGGWIGPDRAALKKIIALIAFLAIVAAPATDHAIKKLAAEPLHQGSHADNDEQKDRRAQHTNTW